MPTGLSFPVCHGGGQNPPPMLKPHLGVSDSINLTKKIILEKIEFKFFMYPPLAMERGTKKIKELEFGCRALYLKNWLGYRYFSKSGQGEI